jgi:hypothetical protein
VAELKGHDLDLRLPAGWDGRITVREDAVAAETFRAASGAADVFTPVAQPVVHLANFGLPEERGDFGSGAVELMGTRDVFMVLFEYEPASAVTALFRSPGIPRTLDPAAFDPSNLRKGINGQTGYQAFFNEAGRAFCLYVVLGSAADRNRLVGLVNSVLATVEIAPRADG